MKTTLRNFAIASLLPTLLQGCALLSGGPSPSDAISNTNLIDPQFAQCLSDNGFETWGEIVELDCRSYGIQQLDEIRWMPNLEELLVGTNRLKQIDTSHNPKLRWLLVSRNQLTRLDVSNNKKIERLNLDDNDLGQIVLGDAVELNALYAYKNPVTNVDIEGKPKLKDLGLSGHQLKKLDLSASPLLRSLNLTRGTLEQLDISQNPALVDLRVAKNQLKQLLVANHPKLTYINAELNQLTDVDVSKSENLTQLYLGQNQLRHFELGEATQIEKLRLNHNLLKSLDLSTLTQPKSLVLFQNPLEELTLPEGIDRRIVDANNTPWGASHPVVLSQEPIVELVAAGSILERKGRQYASGFRNVLADKNDFIGIQYSVAWPEGIDVNKMPKQLPIMVRVTHPELTAPSGQKFSQSQWQDNMYINDGNLAMWQFTEDWEMVSGRWQFEVIYKDKVVAKDAMLVQFAFDEEKAKAQVAAKVLEKVFSIDKVLCKNPEFRQCMDLSEGMDINGCMVAVGNHKANCRNRAATELSYEQAQDSEVLRGIMFDYLNCLIEEQGAIDNLPEEQAANCQILGK
ncbi:DUF3859 domain-containing protein [Ferrimonas aestuarii]|nr:DUF3859 domain-containing protein [Ferrimonas aestuarii]